MNIINKVYRKFVGRGLQGSRKGVARDKTIRKSSLPLL